MAVNAVQNQTPVQQAAQAPQAKQVEHRAARNLAGPLGVAAYDIGKALSEGKTIGQAIDTHIDKAKATAEANKQDLKRAYNETKEDFKDKPLQVGVLGIVGTFIKHLFE